MTYRETGRRVDVRCYRASSLKILNKDYIVITGHGLDNVLSGVLSTKRLKYGTRGEGET